MMRILLMAIGLLSLGFLGCSSERTQPHLDNTAYTKEHAIMNDELERIMHDYNHLVFENYYSELERDHARVHYSQKMASLIERMVVDTNRMGALKERLNLSDQKRVEYGEYVDALKEENERLSSFASAYNTREVERSMERIVGICNACHRTFRGAL